MEDEIEIETIADIVSGSLSGDPDYRTLASTMKFTALDCGEVYIRTGGGSYFRLIVETVSPDDIEGWGIEFDEDTTNAG